MWPEPEGRGPKDGAGRPEPERLSKESEGTLAAESAGGDFFLNRRRPARLREAGAGRPGPGCRGREAGGQGELSWSSEQAVVSFFKSVGISPGPEGRSRMPEGTSGVEKAGGSCLPAASIPKPEGRISEGTSAAGSAGGSFFR